MLSAARHSPALWLGLSCLLVASCTYDFKQFDTEPPERTDMPDAQEPNLVDAPDFGDVEPSDADSDALAPDVGEDMSTPPENYGTRCDDDSACGQLACLGGICTSVCTDDVECPADLRCANRAPAGLCAVPCGAKAVCAPGLACARTLDGCFADRDADGTADLDDNCPDLPNADQRNLDGDPYGDACDDDPACPVGHVDGILRRGPVAHGADTPATPQYAYDWIVAAGGRGQDALSSALAAFVGPDTVSSALPYPAEHFGAVQIRAGEYVLTPGDLGTGAQFGRFLHLYRDGTLAFGVPFHPPVFDPVLASTPDGGLFFVATSGGGAPTTRWEVGRYDDALGRFQPIGGADDGVALRWRATRDLAGRITFYSTLVDPAVRAGRLVHVEPQARDVVIEAVFYPDADGSFDPLLAPAPGGGYFAWDRATGRGFTFDGVGFTEVPELAIAPPQGASWISQPTGPGLHIVAPAQDPTMLQATSYAIACLPAMSGVDRDGDGTPDARDLCPDDPTATDSDLDGDLIGDACDPDADGDGLDDVDDPSPFDTDNDGVLNVDDPDDDADGVDDAMDRSPLDTDDDFLRNDVDPDIDQDGVPNVDEIAAGTNPLDPLHFTRSGTVAWVEGGEVRFAPLQALAAPSVLDRVTTTQPSSVRFSPDGQAILLVAGPIGTTSQVEFTALGGAASLFETGVTLRGADIVSATMTVVTELVLAHDRLGDPTQSDLSLFSAANNGLTPLVTVLTEIGTPDISGVDVAFTAQPQGCDNCRSPYVMGVTGTIPRIVAPMVSNPATIRYNDGAITLLGDAADGNGRSAWYGEPSNPSELRPPDAIDVSGAVGFADGYVVVAASTTEGHALWLWNGSQQSWHALVDTIEPVTELDWTR